MLGSLDDFNPEVDIVPVEQLVALDRWALNRAAELQRQIVCAYDSYQFHLIYQKLHNFCIVDLGGFYLDILKDRLYTAKSDSASRRSAQTALYHIAEAFTRWISPILSYTADELWDALPPLADREDSVFLAEWHCFPETEAETDSDLDEHYWSLVADVKTAINKVIEVKRKEGLIGKALTASVTLYCDGDLHQHLSRLQDELRFVLITSEATVVATSAPEDAMATEIEGLSVVVTANHNPKCTRCWHHRGDVGAVADHPELCGRCVDNVDGSGELRQFA